MFGIILKVVLLCILGAVALTGLALVLGISLGCGYLMGLLVNAFFHLPLWLGVGIFTIVFGVSLIGPLVGWWEEEARHSWVPMLAAMWMFDRMTERGG